MSVGVDIADSLIKLGELFRTLLNMILYPIKQVELNSGLQEEL